MTVSLSGASFINVGGERLESESDSLERPTVTSSRAKSSGQRHNSRQLRYNLPSTSLTIATHSMEPRELSSVGGPSLIASRTLWPEHYSSSTTEAASSDLCKNTTSTSNVSSSGASTESRVLLRCSNNGRTDPMYGARTFGMVLSHLERLTPLAHSLGVFVISSRDCHHRHQRIRLHQGMLPPLWQECFQQHNMGVAEAWLGVGRRSAESKQ